MLDPDGRIQIWNTGAGYMLGYSASEVVGRHFSLLFAGADAGNGKPAWELEQAKASGRLQEEVWLARKDGSRSWIRVVIVPIYGVDTRLGIPRKCGQEKEPYSP